MMEVIKRGALEAVEESKPVALMFGTVTRIAPLAINIEQRFTIPADMILLTSNVIDKKTEVRINNGSKDGAVIYNSLKTGDKVLILRMQGGQKYVVLDRLVKA